MDRLSPTTKLQERKGKRFISRNSLSLKKIQLAFLFAFGLSYMPFSFANSDAVDAFELKNFAVAKDLFTESLKENDKDATAIQYLGKIALHEGEFDDAEEYIEKAQKLAPEDASIQFDAARIMGAQAQDSSIFSAPGYAEKSLNAFKKAATLKPDEIKYRRGLMEFYLFAPGFVGGDEELALVEAEAINKLDEVKGFVALVAVYQKTEDTKKIEALFKEIESKFSKSPSVFLQRGFYYQSLEQYDKALLDFKIASKMKPEDEEDSSVDAAFYQIGRNSVISKSNYAEGISALKTYIETNPAYPDLPSLAWAKYRLGLLYVGSGDKKSGKVLYKQAKKETKDKGLLKQLKKSMRKVR